MSTPTVDGDVIADLESHIADVLTCQFCAAPAHTLARMRCCGRATLCCERHFRQWRGTIVKRLRRFARERITPICDEKHHGCGHTFPRGSGFDDVFRVVSPL